MENLNTTADLSRATLKANTTYTGTINLLYKTKSAHAGRIGRSETGRQWAPVCLHVHANDHPGENRGGWKWQIKGSIT